MTNVETRTRTVVHHEVSVPVRDGKATRRDVADLLYFADQKYRELHPDDPHISGDQRLYDDAYYIEPRDETLVAVIPVEQS
jgi:hypothetical protein